MVLKKQEGAESRTEKEGFSSQCSLKIERRFLK